MRWLVHLAVCARGFRRQEHVRPETPEIIAAGGKRDDAVQLLQSKRRQESATGKTSEENSALYPSMLLSSKPPWYDPVVESAFMALEPNKSCWYDPAYAPNVIPTLNASVVFLGTAPLYDEANLTDGLASVQTQMDKTADFLGKAFGPTNYSLYSVWHTGTGFYHAVNGNATASVNTTDDHVESMIRNACLLFVDGGNTYALQYFLARESLVTETLKSRLRAGMIYVGASAGAIVAGGSAEPANFKNWKGEGDDLVNWQPNAGVSNLKWSASALSVVGLGLPANDTMRTQVLCTPTTLSFVNTNNGDLAIQQDNSSNCLNLTGLDETAIGVYPHLAEANALDFAVGALLSAETHPVVALPNDVAVVQFAYAGSAGLRLFVPGCYASVFVTTPLSTSFALPDRIPAALDANKTVPAINFHDTTWALESPECANDTISVSVCECFPTWPTRAATEEQLPPCSSCEATLGGGNAATLEFDTVRDAVDSTKLRLDSTSSAGEHRLLLVRLGVEPSLVALPGLALALLLAQVF